MANLPVKEATIVAAVLKHLRALPGCYAEKTWGGPFGTAGKPDITGCLRGRRLELEVKRPGETSTPRQRAMQERWRQAGAIVGVVTSVEDVQRLLERETGPEIRST